MDIICPTQLPCTMIYYYHNQGEPMKVGDLVKYNNDWSALNGIMGIIVKISKNRMVSVVTTNGDTYQFGVNNMEVICK